MKDRCSVQMHLQTKSSGIKLPEVHGVKKTLDTNLLPEKQKIILQINKNVENKPRLGQGRTGIKCKKPQLIENITTSTNKSPKILKVPVTQNVSKIKWNFQSSKVVFLCNRTLAASVDKLSFITVDFIRSEGELKEILEGSRKFSEHAQNLSGGEKKEVGHNRT